MAATPQMLQSLGRVARPAGTSGPRGPVGQLVAIPFNNSNSSATGNSKQPAPVQLPVLPVVLSTQQRGNQQQQGKNFISPILDHSGSRKRQDVDHDHSIER